MALEIGGVAIEEFWMMIGEREARILSLGKQLAAAHEEINRLKVLNKALEKPQETGNAL